MASLGKEQKVPRTGVDCTPVRISEEKAARDRGLVELVGDMGRERGWLQRTGAVESAQEQGDSSRDTVSLPLLFPWNMV